MTPTHPTYTHPPNIHAPTRPLAPPPATLRTQRPPPPPPSPAAPPVQSAQRRPPWCCRGLLPGRCGGGRSGCPRWRPRRWRCAGVWGYMGVVGRGCLVDSFATSIVCVWTRSPIRPTHLSSGAQQSRARPSVQRPGKPMKQLPNTLWSCPRAGGVPTSATSVARGRLAGEVPVYMYVCIGGWFREIM